MPEPAAPVEDGHAVAPVGDAREDIGERQQHVVRRHVVPLQPLPRAGLVVDAERAGAFQRRDPLRPLGRVGVGDGAAVPARDLALEALRNHLELRRLRRGGDAGLGRRLVGLRPDQPDAAERALHRDHDDRRRDRLQPPARVVALVRHAARP